MCIQRCCKRFDVVPLELALLCDSKGGGLQDLVGQIVPAAMVPDERVQVYIVSRVLQIMTHDRRLTHCLIDVIGGSYVDIFDFGVVSIELCRFKYCSWGN